MKRKVIAVLTAAVLVLPMAGCAGGGSKASSAASEAKSAVEEAVSKAESAAEEAVSEAKSAVEEAASEAESAVEEAASEAESAVAEAASEAESAVEEAVSEAESAVEEAASEAEEGGLSLDGTVMTYEEYAAAELDTPVLVETYVQAKQSWYEGAATVYTQSEDGAYFLYNMPCTEEEYEKLTEGTKIKVAGYKSEYAGEVEIIDTIFEIEDGSFTAASEVIEPEALEAVMRFAEKKLESLGRRIAAGEIAAAPLDADSCKWCPHSGECPFDPRTPGCAYRGGTGSAEAAWNGIMNGEEQDGRDQLHG